MIGNDTPTRPSQIPLPTTSPEFQDAHLQGSRLTRALRAPKIFAAMPLGPEAIRSSADSRPHAAPGRMVANYLRARR